VAYYSHLGIFVREEAAYGQNSGRLLKLSDFLLLEETAHHIAELSTQLHPVLDARCVKRKLC
jgi:hypothetical protein